MHFLRKCRRIWKMLCLDWPNDGAGRTRSRRRRSIRRRRRAFPDIRRSPDIRLKNEQDWSGKDWTIRCQWCRGTFFSFGLCLISWDKVKWEEGATLICLPDVGLVAIASSSTPCNLQIFCNVFAHSQPRPVYMFEVGVGGCKPSAR